MHTVTVLYIFQVQLTYSTHRDEKYSFYISFPECCSLDVDVDVSEDNVVILLKKETAADKLAHQWQKFFVGLNASQTTVSDAAAPV